MKHKLVLLSILSVISALELELGYNVIEQTGKFCKGRDSCRVGRSTRGPDGVENDWKKRNCFCDNACSVYGDCCIDAKTYVQAEQKVNHLSFECANLKQYGDIYMRNKCSDSFSNSEIKSKCENSLSNQDPFGSTPVTSLETQFTYKNYFCAVCNLDSSNVQFWKPRLECPTLTSYNNRFKNLTKSYIEDNLVQNENDGRWGVNIDTNGVSVFHECSVDPAVPDTLTHLVRSCSGKSTISTCPRDYKVINETVFELCSSYTAMVFEPNAAYRNVHCAICNNASLDKLICLNLGPFGRFNWQQNFNSFSFAVLFDISGKVEDKVGYVHNCQPGELFDPFFKKCRNVICGSEEGKFRNGRCISNSAPISSSVSTISITEATTISTTTRFAFTTTSSTIVEEISEEIIITTDEIEIDLEEIEIFDTTEKPEVENITEAPPPILNSSGAPEEFKTTTKPAEIARENLKDCPKFELQVGEYKMNETEHSVYVEKYDKTLKKGEFEMKGDNLVICVTSELEETSLKFGPGMGYVTLVCLGISIICLSLHIAASFITSELQNLSGKNLLSLSLALLGGYVTFISGMFKDEGQTSLGCSVIAIAMYFFYLSSFFWMMIIAYDVCKTLKMATTQLRVSSGSQWRKFALYSTVAWGLPIAMVTIVTIFDHVESIPKDYKPGFANSDLCWFSNKMALLIYFAVPFAGIMGLNMFLFVFSACMVYDTTSTSSKMNANCSPSRINFHLYLRLAVIMGLTWITGLAAGFVDQEALWYIFIALNTLQGLFIFVAFTCSKKVINGVKESCFKSDRRESQRGLAEDEKWRNLTKKSQLDFTSANSNSSNPVPVASSSLPPDSIPSRYGPRSKTMYTVSKQQVTSVTQNSFNGRYY